MCMHNQIGYMIHTLVSAHDSASTNNLLSNEPIVENTPSAPKKK